MRDWRSFKRLRGDRAGVSGIVLVLAVVLILVVVGFAAYVVYAMTTNDNQDQEDKDLDGDGEPDPIIGYLVPSGVAYFDNSAALGGYVQGMRSVSLTMQDTPVTMDFMAKMADMFSHSDKYQMKFTVTQPATNTVWAPTAIGFDLTVGPMGHTDITKSPNGCLAIRYHGTYHLLVQLLSDEGGVMDERSMDRTF